MGSGTRKEAAAVKLEKLQLVAPPILHSTETSMVTLNAISFVDETEI